MRVYVSGADLVVLREEASECKANTIYHSITG